MPRLSILVPAPGDPQEFEATLVSILQNRPDDVEVLVAHTAEYHDPYKLAGEVCFLPVPEATNTSSLLNAGFEAARSRIVHVIQCGVEVQEDWVESAIDCFSDEHVATVAPVVLRGDDRVLSAGMGYSRWGRAYALAAGKQIDHRTSKSSQLVGPTLTAGFYRRSWWRHVRWNDQLGDDCAAASFNLTLKRLGATTRLAGDCVVRQTEGEGRSVEPLTYREARETELLYWLHRNTPATKPSYAWRALLAAAEATIALPSPRSITGFLGRLAGMTRQGEVRHFQATLAQLTERLAAEQIENESQTLSLENARQRRPETRTQSKRRAA